MELVSATDRFQFQIRAHQITAGTMRSAELRPELPVCSLDQSSLQKQAQQLTCKEGDAGPLGNISTNTITTNPETSEDDEFGDDDFKDLEVMNAGKNGFYYRS